LKTNKYKTPRKQQPEKRGGTQKKTTKKGVWFESPKRKTPGHQFGENKKPMMLGRKKTRFGRVPKTKTKIGGKVQQKNWGWVGGVEPAKKKPSVKNQQKKPTGTPHPSTLLAHWPPSGWEKEKKGDATVGWETPINPP